MHATSMSAGRPSLVGGKTPETGHGIPVFNGSWKSIIRSRSNVCLGPIAATVHVRRNRFIRRTRRLPPLHFDLLILNIPNTRSYRTRPLETRDVLFVNLGFTKTVCPCHTPPKSRTRRMRILKRNRRAGENGDGEYPSFTILVRTHVWST